MSGAATDIGDSWWRNRWIFSQRFIPEIIPRAQARTTLVYRLTPRLSAGVEWNPRTEAGGSKWGPLVNFLAVTESGARPAIILGTSSDRIGTPRGQSFYATASKSLHEWTGIPIAPYAGVAHGTYDDKTRFIGGLNIGFPAGFSSLVIFDGVKVHPTLTWTRGRHQLTGVVAMGKYPGIGYSINF